VNRVGPLALAAGRALSLLLQVVLFAVVARRMSDGAFSRWVGAIAVVSVVAALAEFGLVTAAVLDLTAGKDRAATIVATARLSAVTAVVGVVAALVAAPLFGLPVGVVASLCPWFVLTKVAAAGLAVAQADGRIARLVVSDVAGRAAPVLFVLSFSSLDATRVGEALALGGVIAVGVIGLPGWSTTARVPLRPLVSASAPLGIVGATSMLHSRVDQLVLQARGLSAQLPGYAAAYRVVDAGVALASAAFATLLGEVTASTDRRALIRSRLRLSAAGAVAFAVFIVMLAPVIVHLLLGRSDTDAALALRLLAPAAAAAMANGAVSRLALLAAGPLVLLRLSATLLAVNLTANLVLVGSFGSRGSAVATSLTEGLGLAGSVWLSRRSGRAARARSAPTVPTPLVGTAQSVR
jgi:O-antigen/teichoic acid export membrane protein